MRYLELQDVATLISTGSTVKHTQGDNNILDELEENALDIINSYIGTKYNTEYEFNAKGNKRNNVIKRIAIDILAYDLKTRSSVGEISEIRIIRYKEALKMLERISKDEMNIKLIPLNPELDDSAITSFLLGSDHIVNANIM